MNWRLQNPKGFRENIYTNMTSIKISSSVHSETTSVTSPLSWKSGPMGERVKRGGVGLRLVYNGVLSDAQLAVGVRLVELDR